jgi:hypothetical protein
MVIFEALEPRGYNAANRRALEYLDGASMTRAAV